MTTLRSKMSDAIDTVVRSKPLHDDGKPMHESVVDAAEDVVMRWLWERADLYKDSPMASERQIRYELLAMAKEIEDGTA